MVLSYLELYFIERASLDFIKAEFYHITFGNKKGKQNKLDNVFFNLCHLKSKSSELLF